MPTTKRVTRQRIVNPEHVRSMVASRVRDREAVSLGGRATTATFAPGIKSCHSDRMYSVR